MNDLSMVDAGLDDIVGSIAFAVFGAEAQRTREHPLPPREARVTGVVSIAGGWNGAVSITCSPTFAARAASVMFGRSIATVTSSDIHDAVGELANIVGGNLKPLVHSESSMCVLSIPIVVEGEIAVPGTELQSNWFELLGEWLCVTIFEEVRLS